MYTDPFIAICWTSSSVVYFGANCSCCGSTVLVILTLGWTHTVAWQHLGPCPVQLRVYLLHPIRGLCKWNWHYIPLTWSNPANTVRFLKFKSKWTKNIKIKFQGILLLKKTHETRLTARTQQISHTVLFIVHYNSSLLSSSSSVKR